MSSDDPLTHPRPGPGNLPPKPTPEQIAAAHATLYDAGVHVRTQVAGPEYVGRSLGRDSVGSFVSSFSLPFFFSFLDLGYCTFLGSGAEGDEGGREKGREGVGKWRSRVGESGRW